MNWVKHEPRMTTVSKIAVTLGEKMLHINKAAYEKIGSPKIVDVYYDLEEKAIKIEKSETGRKVTISKVGGYPHVAITLMKVGMPKGIYLYKGDNIFKAS